MKRVFLILLLLKTGVGCFSQSTSFTHSNLAFEVGEEVCYRGVYNWAFIWVNAGDVVFRVRDTTYLNQPAYYFCAKGWSLKEYDWFFKVRDKFESIVLKDGFRPVWFERNTSEGSTKVFNRYIYNYSDSTVTIASRTNDRPYKVENKQLPNNTFDLLSAIYYCRNLNFDNCEINEKIPISMIVDNDIFNLFIRYRGRERIISRDKKAYSTIKFSVLLVEGTVFNAGEDMTVWITDDTNRIPVLVEAKILVGSVKAILK